MKTKGSQNAKSAKSSDNTKPGKVGSSLGAGVKFPIPNHPEACNVAKGPGGKMDKP